MGRHQQTGYLASGTVLSRRYEIRAPLGHGGASVVYRAYDLLLHRLVALKALTEHAAEQPHAAERFEREARLLAALNHPSIVTVHDVQVDDGVPYLVMKLLEGSTLAEVIARHGPMEPRRAAGIAQTVADALVCAHAAGIVHRDIKPHNVMLTADGRVTLLDFGIARVAAWTPLTDSTLVRGTAEYLSPEQARGEPLDGRSDIYALGITLYEMLTGHPPFSDASALAVVYQHIEQPPPAVPAAPEELAGIVRSCLAKAPAHRPPNATILSDALRAFVSHAVIPLPGDETGAMDTTSSPADTTVYETRLAGLRRGLAAGVAAVALALTGLGVFLWQSHGTAMGRPSLGSPARLDASMACDNWLGPRVSLDWRAAAAADGYVVYRSDDHGPFAKVGILSGRSASSFTDHGLKPNTTYDYRIRATAGSRLSNGAAGADVHTPYVCL